MRKTVATFILLSTFLTGSRLLGITSLKNPPTAFITNNTAFLELTDYLVLLNEKNRAVKIEDIRKGYYDDELFSVAPKIPNFGFTKDDYWIMFNVKKTTLWNVKSWFLTIEYPHHDFIDIYIYRGNKLENHFHQGRLYPYHQRKIKDNNFIQEIGNLEKDEIYTFYIHITGSGSKIFSMILHNEKSLKEYTSKKDAAYGFYYGIMIAMILYNLLMFISLKKSVFLYYVFFNLSVNLITGSVHGITYEYLWPEQIWWNYISVPFFISLGNLAATIFCYSFLDNEKIYESSRKVIVFFFFTSLFSLVSTFAIGNGLSRILVTNLTMMFSVAFCIFMMITSIKALVDSSIKSFYFFLGWLIFPIAVFLTVLKSSGFIEHSLMSDNILPLGFLFQSFIFSFSINHNLLSLEREKTKAQAIAVENLKKADSVKNDFLAQTSHELKTPLHGILGILQGILARPALERHIDLEGKLNLISLSAKRLLFLVNNILDFTRINNQDLNLVKSPVNISLVVESALLLLPEISGTKSVKIINRVCRDLPLVDADEIRLKQIILNLISNALKFTSRGRILIYARIANEGMISLAVRDTGIGISKRFIDKIFQPFQQADSGLGKSYNGMGLGLSITKNLVNLHGGEIFVVSRPKKGSRFIVNLPISNKRLVPFSHHKKPEQSWMQAPRNQIIFDFDSATTPGEIGSGNLNGIVLGVDDEPINLEIIRNSLRTTGYWYLTANSGQEALEKIFTTDNQIDLVILDIMMPEITGYDVLTEIRKKFRPHELPVILLSALGDPDSKKRAFEMGANDYIVKPVDSGELLSRVQTLVKLRKAVQSETRLSRIQKEVNLAAALMNSILPQTFLHSSDIQCSFIYEPFEKIGGDYYDFVQISENQFGFIIADVAGHGLAAAMITSMLKAVFSNLREFHHNPPALIREMNQRLYLKGSSNFITMAYFFVDLKSNIARFSSAGHPPALHYNRVTEKIEELNATGAAIGIMPILDIREMAIDFPAGSRLMLYTDGLLDAFEENGHTDGPQHLHDLFRESLNLSPEKSCEHFISNFQYSSTIRVDDVTLMIINTRQNGQYYNLI